MQPGSSSSWHDRSANGIAYDPAVVEVLVGKQSTEIVDDLSVTYLDAAKSVHPAGVVLVDSLKQVRIAFVETDKKHAQS